MTLPCLSSILARSRVGRVSDASGPHHKQGSDGNGELVLASVCVLSDGHGAWHVESGTGRYKNFTAVGTETFGPLTTGPFTNFERFAGIGEFGGHGGDEHGGKQ